MKTLYIDSPPDEIPCWYCGQPCPRFHQDQVLYPSLVKGVSYSQRWEYHCNRHEELDIEVACVGHGADKWFFNRIAVTHKTLRLYWNFYAGDWVHLEEYKQGLPGRSGGEWKFVSLRDWPPKWKIYPTSILNHSAKWLLRFFKLYRVFS